MSIFFPQTFSHFPTQRRLTSQDKRLQGVEYALHLPVSDSFWRCLPQTLQRSENEITKLHNQDLSQRRADSVRAWLVQHGVEASRLQAMGYGQTRPLVPNITSANRARNRRVQFVVQ